MDVMIRCVELEEIKYYLSAFVARKMYISPSCNLSCHSLDTCFGGAAFHKSTS